MKVSYLLVTILILVLYHVQPVLIKEIKDAEIDDIEAKEQARKYAENQSQDRNVVVDLIWVY